MHRKNGSDKAFYFKQFHIHHDRCGMKVGTDGVLLGSWADISNKKKILDIGTGSGLIALMLAQRSSSDTTIDGVEINGQAFEQACENVANSPWRTKIKLSHSSIQNFEVETNYDLVVCNPPYFIKSLKPTDQNRVQSRHATDLTYPDLIASTKRLIAPNGTLNIVLPIRESTEFRKEAGRLGFFTKRKCSVRTKFGKPIDRVLMEFSHGSSDVNKVEELTIQNEKGEWTESYLELVSPFYLWG
ncbi:MAG TPA: methyltransferase [Cyclobacteriaceae bacterium]